MVKIIYAFACSKHGVYVLGRLTLLAFPLGKRFRIGVEFGHTNLAQTWLNVSDIGSTTRAYDGWACSNIKLHTSRWKVQDPLRKVSGLKFEPTINGKNHYLMSCLFLRSLKQPLF
jgi:hypothetical protein